ncbi:MAG: FtsW/RodA/SpoVE family cell cycle protein [Planctomycetota bacterium]
MIGRSRRSGEPGFGETTQVRLPELDWMMFAVAALCCVGIVMSISAQPILEPVLGGLRGRGVFLALGVIALVVMAMVPLHWLRDRAHLLFGAAAVAIACTVLFGVERNHARRWIVVGPMTFQPVDWAKIALVLMTARLLAAPEPKTRSHPFPADLSRLSSALMPAGLMAALLFLQPDKGNAILCCALAGMMALGAGVGFRWMLVPAVGAVWLVSRIVLGDGYSGGRVARWASGDHPDQIAAARQSFESGGFTGAGLGAGWRQHGYVPEVRNDMVFSIVGEELGLVGALGVVGLFALLGVMCFRLVLRMQDPFCRSVVLGCTVVVCSQALLNMLVTTGAMPAKGIDLPFVSSGGTNLTASLGAIGLIGNAARTDSVSH